MLLYIVKTMRPRQWIKNLMVFFPLVFTLRQYWQPFSSEMYSFFAVSAVAFLLFCVLSGVIYLINDLVDIEKDRRHPTKKNRPLASGALKPSAAVVAIVVLLAITFPLSYVLRPQFALMAGIYFVVMLAYSYVLKNMVIIDVFTLAAGLVLRAIAGAEAIAVPPSPWLYVCTVLLGLFIGFSKRRQELILLEGDATNHRLILKEYTPEVLDEMIAVTTASFVMAYSTYTYLAPNLPNNHYMMLTIPFALYAIFRLLYLVHIKNEGGSPEEMVVRDHPLFVSLVLWACAIVGILFLYGHA